MLSSSNRMLRFIIELSNCLATKRQKGGAMHYAVFVMLVFGMVSVLMINYLDLSFKEDLIFYKNSELLDNCSSAIVRVASEPELLRSEDVFQLDLFDDGEALVDVTCSRWGLMHKVIANAGWKHLRRNKVVLMAEVEGARPALWMPERNRYLSLVGQSRIKGDVHLSELGLRRANIEGRYFESSFLHHGEMHTSPLQMSHMDEDLFNWVHRYSTSDDLISDSLIAYETIRQTPLVKQSFGLKSLVVKARNSVSLDKGVFQDNVVIVSSDTIVVWPSVDLRNVVLMADVIVFKTGFEGQLQAIARKELIVEDNCSFSYPSFIGAMSALPEVKVSIGEGLYFNGGLFCFSKHAEEEKTVLSIGKTDEIVGKVYTNGDFTMKGSLIGSLYCNRFVYQTSRAFYENFMLDLVIDENALPRNYASFCVGQEMVTFKTVLECQSY